MAFIIRLSAADIFRLGFPEMLRNVLIFFPFLVACELLVPVLGPDSCEEEGQRECAGSTLVACVQGVLIRQECGEVGCDPGRGVCSSCGDGILAPPEECDDGNPFSGDGCSAFCLLEPPSVCGNGILEAGEGCDDGNTEEGDGCDAQCVPESCGDGVRQDPEECDGGDLGGQSCESLGFLEGQLACLEDCFLDTRGCIPREVCTSGADEDQDGLIDCADPDCTFACQNACNEPTEIFENSVVSGTNAGHSNNNSVSFCDIDALGGIAPEVAFRFTAPEAGTFLITLLPQGVDLGFYVRTTCDDQSTQVECVDLEPAGDVEFLQLNAAAGQTFFIIVDGFNGAVGNFTLSIGRL